MNDKYAVTLDLSEDQKSIRIVGDAAALRRDRRIMMSLKRIDPGFDKATLTLSVGDRDLSDVLRDLHNAFSARGYSDSNNDAAASVLGDFYAREKAFADFSEKARRIRSNDCEQETLNRSLTCLWLAFLDDSFILSNFYRPITWPFRKTRRISLFRAPVRRQLCLVRTHIFIT